MAFQLRALTIAAGGAIRGIRWTKRDLIRIGWMRPAGRIPVTPDFVHLGQDVAVRQRKALHFCKDNQQIIPYD